METLNNEALSLNVLDYYTQEKPWDEEGARINPEATFEDVWNAIQGKNPDGDVYDVLGVHDSLIRENVFAKLAELLDVDYDEIYHTWLYGVDESYRSRVDATKKLEEAYKAEQAKSNTTKLIESFGNILENMDTKLFGLTVELTNEDENGHKCFKAWDSTNLDNSFEFCQEPDEDYEAAIGQALDDHFAPAAGLDRAELTDWYFAEDGIHGEASVTGYIYGE